MDSTNSEKLSEEIGNEICQMTTSLFLLLCNVTIVILSFFNALFRSTYWFKIFKQSRQFNNHCPSLFLRNKTKAVPKTRMDIII